MDIKDIHKESSYFFKAIPAILWQFLFFYIPLGIVLGLSFFSMENGHIQFDLSYYKELFHIVYWTIIGRSFGLALSTALLCLFIGYPLAYYVAIRKRSYKNLFLFFLIVPFWTNFLVLTYAWFFVLDPHGILNNILLQLGIINSPLMLLNNYFSVLLVMVYSYLPFMVLPLFSTLERINFSLIEASQDLGATISQTFWRIIMPMSMPGIRTGVLLVFVPAFGEFVIPMLIGGDKNMYVGSLIAHYFFIDQNPYAGGAFTVMSSLALFMAVGVIVFFMQDKRPGKEIL